MESELLEIWKEFANREILIIIVELKIEITSLMTEYNKIHRDEYV